MVRKLWMTSTLLTLAVLNGLAYGGKEDQGAAANPQTPSGFASAPLTSVAAQAPSSTVDVTNEAGIRDITTEALSAAAYMYQTGCCVPAVNFVHRVLRNLPVERDEADAGYSSSGPLSDSEEQGSSGYRWVSESELKAILDQYTIRPTESGGHEVSVDNFPYPLFVNSIEEVIAPRSNNASSCCAEGGCCKESGCCALVGYQQAGKSCCAESTSKTCCPAGACCAKAKSNCASSCQSCPTACGKDCCATSACQGCPKACYPVTGPAGACKTGCAGCGKPCAGVSGVTVSVPAMQIFPRVNTATCQGCPILKLKSSVPQFISSRPVYPDPVLWNGQQPTTIIFIGDVKQRPNFVAPHPPHPPQPVGHFTPVQQWPQPNLRFHVVGVRQPRVTKVVQEINEIRYTDDGHVNHRRYIVIRNVAPGPIGGTGGEQRIEDVDFVAPMPYAQPAQRKYHPVQVQPGYSGSALPR